VVLVLCRYSSYSAYRHIYVYVLSATYMIDKDIVVVYYVKKVG
jgi:hypothetical protein